MPIREPIRYELSPRKLDVGEQWLTLTLENVSDDEMTSVSVNLNTTNFVDLEVLGTGEFIPAMRPEEEVILTFKVRAQRTTDVYVILDGLKDGDPFYWESPYITIDIGAPIAEITSLFVLSEPYPYLTKDLQAECTVFGNEAATGLTVHFWVDTPSEESVDLGEVGVPALKKGGFQTVRAEYITAEEGLHRFYAYLYDGIKLLDRETDLIYVREEE